MTNPQPKPPVGGRPININAVARKRIGELGAPTYSVQLAPRVEEIIRDRAAELIRKYEEKVAMCRAQLATDMGALITPRVLNQAFKADTALTAQQQQNNQQQKETNHESPQQ
jgi:hypothetical protein